MGRIQLYIIAGFIVFSSLCGIYYSWRSGIEREALLEYNQKQLEQSIKDKEEMQKKLANIEVKQKEIQAENEATKKVFKEDMNSIAADLDKKEVIETDRTSSQILKDTINKLKGHVK